MPQQQAVDDWFQAFEHPLKDVMLRVRTIVLAADPRIDECIKWQSPTFVFEGNLASFNPRTKKHVSLMFHTGATIPGQHPALEGGGGTARYLKIADLAEAERLRPDLEAIVRSWCELKAAPKQKACSPKEQQVAAQEKAATKQKAAAKHLATAKPQTTAMQKATAKQKAAAQQQTTAKQKVRQKPR